MPVSDGSGYGNKPAYCGSFHAIRHVVPVRYGAFKYSGKNLNDAGTVQVNWKVGMTGLTPKQRERFDAMCDDIDEFAAWYRAKHS